MPASLHRSLAALVVVLSALLVSGCVSQQTADRADQRVMPGGLTHAELQVAGQVARREAAREDVQLRSASAGVVTRAMRSGLGAQGHDCPPGRLVHVRLVGAFPHPTQAPLAGTDDQVGGKDVVADPVTGRVCASTYLFGRIVTDLSLVRLFGS